MPLSLPIPIMVSLKIELDRKMAIRTCRSSNYGTGNRESHHVDNGLLLATKSAAFAEQRVIGTALLRSIVKKGAQRGEACQI